MNTMDTFLPCIEHPPGGGDEAGVFLHAQAVRQGAHAADLTIIGLNIHSDMLCNLGLRKQNPT